MASKSRQPASPPSPSAPPKGILKNSSSEMPPNPMPIAAGTPRERERDLLYPDYPMMGPLSDSRELAPHAMPGHKEGMGGHNDGTGQIAKGTCAVCQQTVYNSQERTKNKDGKCVRAVAPCRPRVQRRWAHVLSRNCRLCLTLCTLYRSVRARCVRRGRRHAAARSGVAVARRRTPRRSGLLAAAGRRQATTGGAGGQNQWPGHTVRRGVLWV